MHPQVGVHMPSTKDRTRAGTFQAPKEELSFLISPCIYQLPTITERESKQLPLCYNGYTTLPKRAKNTLYSLTCKKSSMLPSSAQENIQLQAELQKDTKVPGLQKNVHFAWVARERGLFLFGQGPISLSK